MDDNKLGIITNLFEGKVSTTKLITISGDAIKENKVLKVKLNTSLKDIKCYLQLYGKINLTRTSYQII